MTFLTGPASSPRDASIHRLVSRAKPPWGEVQIQRSRGSGLRISVLHARNNKVDLSARAAINVSGAMTGARTAPGVKSAETMLT